MRLFLLAAVTMCAFAANSVLTRLALAEGAIGAMEFAALRTVAGAVALVLLVTLGGKGGVRAVLRPQRQRVVPVLALVAYMVGFSMAYIVLPTGVGALILFGGVQVTMFAGAVFAREAVPLRRWIGACLALAGLAWIMWPGAGATAPLFWSGLMGLAAVGWGIYSLRGRGETAPLRATAANFVYAVPLVAVVAAALVGPYAQASVTGVGLAIVAGAVTSGMGYALWYRVLPRLSASVAALTQLSVPILAMLGGIVFLAEPLTVDFVIAAVLVLSGIALGVLAPYRTITSSGS